MRIILSVEGVEDVLAKFGGMAKAGQSAEFRQSVSEIADRLIDEIKANTPVSQSDYTPPGHEPGTLRDEGIGKNVIQHGGLTAVYIGFTQTGWYGIFPEFGTVNMSARPFMIPAFERNKQMIIDGVSDAWGQGFFKI